MVTMDIFNNNAFSMMSLTTAIEKVPFRPSFLGDMGIFTTCPIRTETAAIEKKEGRLALIQTSERGAPLENAEKDSRDMRYYKTVRLAKQDTINAAEIQGIRAFGTENIFQQVQAEVASRLMRLNEDLELTFEHHRLGAVQGVVLNADGSIIVDWFDVLGVSRPKEIIFKVSDSKFDVLQACTDLSRLVEDAALGAWVVGSTLIHALAGDEFYDKVFSHPSVEKTYLNYHAAAELRENKAYRSFHLKGITFHNYRGTKSGEVGIKPDKAAFFPVGARGVFEVAHSPGESFDFVNTRGKERYAMLIQDKDRNAWVKPEIYSYPLHICTRPEMLHSAKLG